MQLRIGYMTNAELAEWAGVSPQYMSSGKKTWAKKVLAQYAEYEIVRGGVNIITIDNPFYEGKAKRQIENKLYKNWGNKREKLDNCKNVARKLSKVLKNVEIKDSTLYDYVCQVKREQFGIPKVRAGEKGTCKYVYCKINSDGTGSYFTDSEKKILEKLKEKYNISEAYMTRWINSMGARQDYESGALTQEEYESILMDNDLYVAEVWRKINCDFERMIDDQCGFRLELDLIEENENVI